MFQSRSLFIKCAAVSAVVIFLVLLLSEQGLSFTDLEFGLGQQRHRHKPGRGRGGKHGQSTNGSNGIGSNLTCSNGTVPTVASWEKPEHVSKIMGLVFYGRRPTVSILDCYLQVRMRLTYLFATDHPANTLGFVAQREKKPHDAKTRETEKPGQERGSTGRRNLRGPHEGRSRPGGPGEDAGARARLHQAGSRSRQGWLLQRL